MFDPLLAISPLDGRYQKKTSQLQTHFSEFGLIKARLFVEIKWLIYLCNELKLPGTQELTDQQLKQLLEVHSYFDVEQARSVKEIEKTTNHDVKAVEYFLKEKLAELNLSELTEFVHFGCTSEDINNTSYGLILKTAIKEEIEPKLKEVLTAIEKVAKEQKGTTMMGRTHGQPASPTTLGKEMANYAYRIRRQLERLERVEMLGKFNGATGNYNAHQITYPEVDWVEANKKFIESIGLTPNLWTTQIEPHDWFAEVFAIMKHANLIILDLATDMWSYISLNYFKQITKKGEVGSSTMPHKVNPIDFENGEGNLQIANSFFSFLERKLMQSRLQRDLSDSTVQRNMGSALAYSYLAYQGVLKGFSKVEVNQDTITLDLDSNWAIIGEALQSIMRREGIDKPYEKLKELTRGKEVNESTIKKFVEGLEVSDKVKKEMGQITPHNYSGLATKLVDLYFKNNK